MESILTSIKKLLGIEEDYEHFDQDIIMHINTVFMVLNELGVGPSEGYMIEDEVNTWDEFIPDMNSLALSSIKSYIYLKVKLMFDPPSNSAAIENINKNIAELEWRLNVLVE